MGPVPWPEDEFEAIKDCAWRWSRFVLPIGRPVECCAAAQGAAAFQAEDVSRLRPASAEFGSGDSTASLARLSPVEAKSVVRLRRAEERRLTKDGPLVGN